MERPSLGRTCKGEKADGSPCKARPLAQSSYCFFHDSATARERREAQRAGGIERSRKRASLAPGTANWPLKTAAHVCDLLEAMTNKVLEGELDPKLAKCIAYMCMLLLKAQANSQIEERLAELESVVRAQSLDTGPLPPPEPDLALAPATEETEVDGG